MSIENTNQSELAVSFGLCSCPSETFWCLKMLIREISASLCGDCFHNSSEIFVLDIFLHYVVIVCVVAFVTYALDRHIKGHPPILDLLCGRELLLGPFKHGASEINRSTWLPLVTSILIESTPEMTPWWLAFSSTPHTSQGIHTSQGF